MEQEDGWLGRWQRPESMTERLNLYLHPSSRTWDPMAETWDLKVSAPANYPVPGLPLIGASLWSTEPLSLRAPS
jgi:hypothetical protein